MATKKDDKRSALLQAALDLFAEKGFHGAPTALIARRAGVASGTLFCYFKTKDELILALFREVRAKLVEAMEPFPLQMPVRERFIRTISGILRFVIENPKEFIFAEQYHFSPYNTAEEEGSLERNSPIRYLLLQAREEQIFKNLPLLLLESMVFGPIVSLAKEHASRGTPISEEMIRLTAEACWDALKR
jgi:AcrR family transcriptional regulator